jgi:hypothetical protein
LVGEDSCLMNRHSPSPRAMSNRAIMFWQTTLGALVTLVLYLALANCGKSARLPITLVWSGQYSPSQAVVCATVTNMTTHAIVLDGVLLEWKDPSGHLGRATAFHGWNHTLPPGDFVTTACCVPLDAEKVRAATIDDEPGHILRLALRLHLDRYPKVFALLDRRSVPYTFSCYYTHRGAWVANPRRGTNERQALRSDPTRQSAAAAPVADVGRSRPRRRGG